MLDNYLILTALKKRSHRARWLNSVYNGNSTKVLSQEELDAEPESDGEPESEREPDGEPGGEPDEVAVQESDAVRGWQDEQRL